MKAKSIIILLLALTYLGCNKDNVNTSKSLTGKWKLIKYQNVLNASMELEPSNIDRSIIMTFSDDEVRGYINGRTVTNDVFGKYQLSQNNKIQVLSFGGTKIAEPRWGAKFWSAMHSVTSFKREYNKLFIYFNSDTELMEFNRQ